MNIYINTSDIASYIGQNTWDSITAFERLWKKFEVFNVSEEIQETLSNTQKEYVSSMFTTKEQKVEKYIPLDTIKEVTDNKDLTILEQKEKVNTLVNEVKDITPDKRVQLRKNTHSIINTSFGITNEAAVLTEVEVKSKQVLDKTQVLLKKPFDCQSISKTGYIFKNKYTICGKIDGNDKENKRIIEVKNRVKGFFKNLRDYEKTQIHVYMWLTDYTEALLVEKHRDNTKNTAIYFSDEYFQMITADLCTFLEKFETFLADTEKKTEYSLMSNPQKQFFIDSFFIEVL
jgi:hypothetical protein